MRRRIFIIALLVIIVLGYFGYKGYNYTLYNSKNISSKDYNEFMSSFQINEDMVINRKDLEKDAYLTFKNVKIRNDFKEYQLEYNTEEEDVYCLKDDSGNTISVFMIRIEKSNIDYILNEDALMAEEEKQQFLKENNITNDLELFDYVVKEHNISNNIFTSVRNMKHNYMTLYYTYTTLGNPTYVTKITGDYEGYLIGGEESQQWLNINTVNILKNDKIYKFSFWGNEQFTEQYIKDILETVIIS